MNFNENIAFVNDIIILLLFDLIKSRLMNINVRRDCVLWK